MTRWELRGFLSAGLLLTLAACSANDDTTYNAPKMGGSDGSTDDVTTSGGSGGDSGAGKDGGDKDGGDSSSAAGNGGKAGSGGEVDAGRDISFAYDAPDFDSQDATCATLTAQAEIVPLDVYIMQDRSGSMANGGTEDCNIGSSETWKWCYAINALAGYFDDPSAATNYIALQYFPISGESCSTGGACSTPAVPLGLLDATQRTALRNSLNATVPSGDHTPIEAALRGLTSYTGALKAGGSTHTIIGLLITDGQPEGACDTNASNLRDIIASHYQATGIRTFTIGMSGADFNTLDTIASGGGVPQHNNYCNSGSCYYYSVGNGNPTVFIEVLKAIQQTAVSCTYAMPQPEAGLVDPNKVKVHYTAGGVGDPAEIARVNSQADCDASTGGWYFDDNASPTTISLCPVNCTIVQADTAAKLEILTGCLGT